MTSNRWCRVLVGLTVITGAMASRPRAVGAQPAQSPTPVALFPATGTNVAPNILEAARDILKDHLQRTQRYTVIALGGAAAAAEPTAAEAAQQAAAAGAWQAIVLRIIHLGTTARVRMTVYVAGTGQVAYWDSIPVTGGPDELDVALERLVHALVIGKPVRESAELETVTARETQTLNRRLANRTFGLHLFSLMPFRTADGDFHAVPGVGLVWMYDARSWMADVALDAGGREGSSVFDVSLGAYYPLHGEDFTPYVGGSVKWAFMKLGGRGSSGIVFQPAVGIMLGRLSTAQVRVEVGYFFNTFGETALDAQGLAAGPARYGQGLLFSAGLGF